MFTILEVLTYLSDDLAPGASFTLQLVPDLTSDDFLYGRVFSNEESISVPAGDWQNTTLIEYEIVLGTSSLINEQGEVVGTVEGRTTGWVAFVPGIGPAASYERYFHATVDCPAGCPGVPPAGTILQTVTLQLTSVPVATANSSWGALKAGY